MVQNTSGPEDDLDVLGTIQPGMLVVDEVNREVGVVEKVYRGGTSLADTGEHRRGRDGEGVAMNDPEDEGLSEVLQDVFDPVDAISDEMRGRLTQTGFIRVGGEGVSGQDRYISAADIHSVSGNFVKLNKPFGSMFHR